MTIAEKKKLVSALNLVGKYMHNEMYGDKQTDWTYGNEHDEMEQSLSIVSTLLRKFDDDFWGF